MMDIIELISTSLDKLQEFPLSFETVSAVEYHILYNPCESAEFPVGSPWLVCTVRSDVHGIRVAGVTGKDHDTYVDDAPGLVEEIKTRVRKQLNELHGRSPS